MVVLDSIYRTCILKYFFLFAFMVFSIPIGQISAAEKETREGTRSDLYGAAIEWLYSEPSSSTNKRFSDMRENFFSRGISSSQQISLRVKGNYGDQEGFDGRFDIGLTQLHARSKRGYDKGNLKLSHEYTGVDAACGLSYFINSHLILYSELALLGPPIKNKVSMSSAAGSVLYTSDYSNEALPLYYPWNFAAAFGMEIPLTESWYAKVHFDSWREGSGKAAGFHFGAGYVL